MILIIKITWNPFDIHMMTLTRCLTLELICMTLQRGVNLHFKSTEDVDVHPLETLSGLDFRTPK